MQWNRSVVTRRRGFGLALLAGAAANACGDPTGAQSEYAAARARWRNTAPSAYEVTVGMSCFCLSSNGATILVRDGAIVSGRDPVTGVALARADADRYPTVERLFADIAAAFGNSESRVDAEYDVTYGFPRRAYIDHRVHWTDDEVGYFLSGFHPR
jgi:hypothetical protein